MKPFKERQGGFTLLEILVALVILSLLMVGLSQGVRASLDLRKDQNRRLGSATELDATQRLLRSVLGRLPLSPDGNRLIGNGEGLAFKGFADRIDLITGLPTGLGAHLQAKMSLFVENRNLVLSWTPHRHEQALTPPAAPMQVVLLRGIEKLELSYWAAPVADQPANWLAQWVQSVAPRLIRVRLRFNDPNRRRWPDMIVAPRP